MCITPLTLKNPKENQCFPIPCGKCPQCVQKRQSQWSFRLQKQAETSVSALFLTLTYNTENVPITKNGMMTLQPEDVTKFLKRLRKQHTEKIKYYYVGEYGGNTNRPHYHMIIYNADMEKIESTWTLGKIHYGKVEGASIGYTLKYMCKDGKTIPAHKNDFRLPEFGRMSNGLGANYLTADIMYHHTDKHNLLNRLWVPLGEIKVSMPRYYKDKLYDNIHKYIIQRDAKQRQIQKEQETPTVDINRQIQSHLALFDKMKKNKHKNKYL